MKRLLPHFSHGKYEVAEVHHEKSWTIQTRHSSYTSELTHGPKTTPGDVVEAQIRVKSSGRRVRTIDAKIVVELDLCRKLKPQQLEILAQRDELKNDFERFFQKQKKCIEETVSKYAEEILRLDGTNTEEIRNVEKKMVEEMIWGEEEQTKTTSKLKKIEQLLFKAFQKC